MLAIMNIDLLILTFLHRFIYLISNLIEILSYDNKLKYLMNIKFTLKKMHNAVL